MRHSQRCNAGLLSCWLIIENTGEVCCAHCTCMAGLGEVCTHVAAVLFYLETAARINGIPSCTQQQCQWVVPSFQHNIPYSPIKSIDFTSAKTKKRKLNDGTPLHPPTPSISSKSLTVQAPEECEVNTFLQKLSQCGTKPSVLSLTPPYADSYIPKSMLPTYPKPLLELFQPKFLELDHSQLLAKCNSTDIRLTEEMIINVEQDTKGQSNSRLWFKYRSGRITASKLKQVCRTNPTMPSQRLIKEICYPELFRFTSAATRWGSVHEKPAREAYTKIMQSLHEDFTVEDSGLVFNCEWPHLGATPDGIINCKCCGRGVLEIKCPYTHRHDGVATVAEEKSSCLKKHEESDAVYLDNDHAYYYQTQAQMFLCKVDYCDFCVCTFPPGSDPQIHIERLSPDPDLWTSCLDASSRFFRDCLLPELLGRRYTRGSTSRGTASQSEQPINEQANDSTVQAAKQDASSSATSETRRLYCYCQQPEDTHEMIGCDNPNCSFEWFHTKCLKLKCIPEGSWYCPDCCKISEC